MNYILLFVAVCLLLIGMSALLSLIMMRIPPLPSTPSVIKKIITQISVTPFSLTITEIGSGYGYMLFRLAKAFPERKIVGIEISLIPFLFSYMIKILGNFKNVQIVYGNAFTIIKKQSIPCQIVVGYLTSASKVLSRLEKLYCLKISNMLILNTYPLKNVRPTKTIHNLGIFKSALYVYQKESHF